jgi:hypothetical protein
LHKLFERAPDALKTLLRNIFNLHLLAELLRDGVVTERLAGIRTQPELLDAYWTQRVLRDDGHRDEREALLESIVECMIAARTLQVFRADLRKDPNVVWLADLERFGLLRAEEREGKPDEDVLLFAHHVLFDYAAARLVFRRGRSPQDLAARLRAEPELALMLAPSLSMTLVEAWNAGDSPARGIFWRLALMLAGAPQLPEVARLAAPMAVAELAVTIADLQPLLDALQIDADRRTAESFVRHLVGALLFLNSAGKGLAGSAGDPWASLAERLSRAITDETADALRPLLFKLTERPEELTPEQLSEAGAASRRLLEYAWQRTPRLGFLVVTAITTTARTVASDPSSTATLLRRALLQEHMRKHAYEELRWIAEEAVRLANYDSDLVVDIYEAAFGFDETSDEKTSIGTSRLLSLTSHRRQDFRSSWYTLAEAFPRIVASHPEAGAKAINRALEGYVKREHPSRDGEERIEASFRFGPKDARFVLDWSHVWHGGGVLGRDDAPSVLAKFEEHLRMLAQEPGGAERFRRILMTLVDEARLAVIWSTMLAAGAARSEILTVHLVPLACAEPILTSNDTRYAVGNS